MMLLILWWVSGVRGFSSRLRSSSEQQDSISSPSISKIDKIHNLLYLYLSIYLSIYCLSIFLGFFISFSLYSILTIYLSSCYIVRVGSFIYLVICLFYFISHYLAIYSYISIYFYNCFIVLTGIISDSCIFIYIPIYSSVYLSTSLFYLPIYFSTCNIVWAGIDVGKLEAKTTYLSI